MYSVALANGGYGILKNFSDDYTKINLLSDFDKHVDTKKININNYLNLKVLYF